jgi:hypothetical protein
VGPPAARGLVGVDHRHISVRLNWIAAQSRPRK